MSERSIEDLVAVYLDRREDEPALLPAEFARGFGPRADELRAAIERTLDTLALFPGAEAKRPRHIGDYELLSELGRGGMGVVYRARETHDAGGEEVALKVLPFAATLEPKALERFRREVAILSRLQHEQIVGIRAWGVHEDSPYLVMDLVCGRPAAAVAPELGERGAAELVRSLALAVHAAHEAGVLHRDIKPQNVIVRADGVPVLLDFGLVHDAAEASLTSTGELLGTPRYMAPEQVAGRPSDARTDVHALGLMLFELATGRPVYDSGTRAAVLRSAARGATPRVLRHGRALPRDLSGIVRTAVARAPARRYPTALALAEDLGRFLAGEPVQARPPGVWVRLSEAAASRPTIPLIGAAALLLVALVGWNAVLPFVHARAAERRAESACGFDRAVAAWAGGRPARATELLERLFEHDSEHPFGRALAAVVEGRPLDARGDPALVAIVAGLQAQSGDDGLERAEASFARAAELAPDSPWPPILLAGAALRADKAGNGGDRARAGRELVAAAARQPGSVAVARELAVLHGREERWAEAEAEYRRALDLDGEDPALWMGLSRALLRQARDDEALAALGRARELSGELDETLANTLAVLLDRSGRRAEAREILARLAAEHPEDATYAFNLAYSLDSEGRVAEALPLYERCLELSPQQPDAVACLAWLLVTAKDESLRDEQRAEELVLRALEHDRGRSDGLLQTAVQVARTSGRTARLADLLETLANEGDVDERTVRIERARRGLRE